MVKEQKTAYSGYPSVDRPWLKFYKSKINDTPDPECSIYEYLWENNKNYLGDTALIYKNKKITYEQLFINIDQVASALINIGVSSGDIVVMYLPAIPEEVYLLYAINRIGAIAHYLFPQTPVNNICDTLNLLKTKVFICTGQIDIDENIVYRSTQIQRIIRAGLDDRENIQSQNPRTLSWSTFLETGRKEIREYKNPNEVCFIAKTGGTTGIPKNVMLSDIGFNMIVQQYLNSEMDYMRGEKWLRLWPIFSATAAVCSNHLPLCAGMALVLIPDADIRDIDKIILKEEPNHIPMVPAILEIMIQSHLLENTNLSFLKTVGCGGSGMSEEFEKKAKSFLKAHDVKAILGCGYGMTENCSVATVRMNANTEKIGSAGVPLRETIVGVFEPNSITELPYNTEGEICIQSKSHMVGYYNEPELTKAVLIKHNDGKIWLHTGDIGIIDEDGFVFIKNRIQRYIFTYPSDKVYPNELEETIGKIEGVDKIAVIAELDVEHSGYKVPACYIVCKVGHSQELVKKRVSNFCKDNLSQHSRPRHIYFIDEMPLTPIGKIDIAKLEKEAERFVRG